MLDFNFCHFKKLKETDGIMLNTSEIVGKCVEVDLASYDILETKYSKV